VAVPSPLSTKVTPLGRPPVSDSAGTGVPVVVTVMMPADPSVKVVLSPEVMVGAPSTVRVNDCVASGLTPLEAVMLSGYVPLVPTAGVPARVAVPSPLSTKVTRSAGCRSPTAPHPGCRSRSP